MDHVPARITWRRELLAAGFAAGDVRQLLRVGALVSVRRGAYLTGALPPILSCVTSSWCEPPSPTSPRTPW
jgi:hypothetical protein